MLIFSIIILLLGRFSDVTKKPHKADLIVYLGGGSGHRIKHAYDLYVQGASASKVIALTGADNFAKNFKKYELDWRAYYLKTV